MNAGTLETRDLRLVRAIAEAGGATRAAKQLHLSQSAVSHQLRGLEERLGLLLFRRDGRKLVITTAGERLVEVSHQVLGSLWQAELELRRGALVERPKLRVGTQCYTAYHWLPRALAALMTEHPEVDLTLASEVLGDATAALSENIVDLVLCVMPPQRGAYKRVPLFEDELVLAVPRGHRLATKKYVEGRDLKNETLILNNASAPERQRVKRLVFGTADAKLARVLRLPVTEAVLELVQAGLGVSIVPAFTLNVRASRGEVVAVRLTQPGIKRQWAGVFSQTSPLARPIRTLLGTLKAGAPVTNSP
jgi:LysR family transcriptional regulator, regulator for metE and metH